MDASEVIFSNHKHNPTRSWFRRMIDQLNQDGITVVMHPILWGRISLFYAYGHYYDGRENVYFTDYSQNTRETHKEYMSRQSLPIGGILYPVVLQDNMSQFGIEFVNTNGECLGIIENVICSQEDD
jgi:hypothetical protein